MIYFSDLAEKILEFANKFEKVKLIQDHTHSSSQLLIGESVSARPEEEIIYI